MGVQNFWQLIESTGRPVNMNQGLEGKILAIDISIWLHQAAKGMRDRQNPHILLLLHRICKLLHFKIKPIFVFDGGVPELKRRTLAERKQRRDVAANKVKEANTKIRTNYLKMLAIQQLRGESIDSLALPNVPENEKDLFELPDNHLRGQLDSIDSDETDEDEIIETNDFQPIRKMARTTRNSTSDSTARTTASTKYSYALPNVDEIDVDTLNHLPKEMQYDILNEMKEKLKRGQRQRDELPQKSDDFSDYQVQKLLKQNSVSKKILTLNKAIKREKLDIPVDSNARVYTGKLASDADTQYVLIKSNEQPVSLTQMSTPPPAFNRRSTSNFSADQMINRDPIAALTGQKKTPTTQTESKDLDQNRSVSPSIDRSTSDTIVNVQFEEKTNVSPSPETFSQKIETNDQQYENEDRALEIAIQRSLEDQKGSTIETSDDSDSDDADFLPPVTIPTINEKVLVSMLFKDPVEKDINTSLESIETESNRESTNSSEMIEDLQSFIEEQHELSNVSVPLPSQTEQFDQLQTELMDDTAVQLNRARGNERLTATLTDTMHEDTKYLLRLFGIPYVTSPSEAEAQCAFLNFSKQCDGVITDDSDVWLFGASKVYRHFFRQNQLVEFYDSTIIETQLGLDRESMIAIGMIVGSDYTKGISNAGIMTAIEILQEFHGNCMERLEKFRRWWKKAQAPNFSIQSKVLKRLKTLEIFEGFPNRAVYEAYTNPKIDDDQTKFSWAMPQLQLIREFIGTKLKWERQKIDEMILPVIKRWNSKEVQSRIDAFFAPLPFQGTSNQINRNKRLMSALDLLKQKTKEAKENPQAFESTDDDQEGELSNIPAIASVALKKRKRSNTTRLMENVLLTAERTKSSTKLRTKKNSQPVGPVLSEDEES